MNLNKFFIREYGVIKDDSGNTLNTVRIKNSEKSFTNGKKTYNVSRSDVNKDIQKGMIFTYIRYFYNVHNPNPYGMANKNKTQFAPLMDAELYNVLLEAEVLKKLNTINSSWFKDISLGHVVVGLCVLALIGYALSSGMSGFT